jgi:hypothetical protein
MRGAGRAHCKHIVESGPVVGIEHNTSCLVEQNGYPVGLIVCTDAGAQP